MESKLDRETIGRERDRRAAGPGLRRIDDREDDRRDPRGRCDAEVDVRRPLEDRK